MKVWIDQFGDVVWNDSTHPATSFWTDCLSDGCRLNVDDEDNEDRLNGLWMILK